MEMRVDPQSLYVIPFGTLRDGPPPMDLFKDSGMNRLSATSDRTNTAKWNLKNTR